jgi:type I restriction enzyme S subunit
MSFPRYASYKDSGVEWLGEVPAHWEVMPLKRDLEFLTSGSRGWAEHYSDNGSLFLRIGNLRRDGITLDLSDLQRVEVPDGAEGARTCTRPGDLLFSITAYLGSVAVVPEDLEEAYVSQHVALARLKRRRLLPQWAAYLTVSHVGQNQLATSGYGGTKIQLGLGDVADIGMTVPPLVEQQVIAAFLERETAKIDALVAEQQRLIELLKEKRQAVISHAVTKGLNPDAPMKDSGIEWLGEVPAHWAVGSIKRFLTSLDSRRIPLSGEERSVRSGEYPYYGASGIIDWIDEYIFDQELVLVSEDGANLINRSTPIAFVARGKYWVNNHAHILRPFDDVVDYWADRIESIDLFPFVTGSAQPKLTIDALMNLVIAVPPTRNDRLEIKEACRQVRGELSALIGEAEKAVALLQERRSALISAAVTGQIDVRGLAQADAA